MDSKLEIARRLFLRAAALSASGFALGACGGGGSTDAAPTAESPTPPAPAPTPPAPAPTPPAPAPTPPAPAPTPPAPAPTPPAPAPTPPAPAPTPPAPAPTPPAPAPAPSGSDDWATRSTAAGVVKANRLNNAANLTPVSLVNATQWVLADATQDHVSLDTTVKPTGSTGSCKFRILNSDGASSGNVGFYFGELRTFTDGDTVWFSFRRRAAADFVYQSFFQDSAHADYTSNKLSILSWYKSSSMPNEIVVNESYGAGVVTGYYQNGLGSFIGVEGGQATPCNNSDINAQPSIDRGVNPLTGTNPDTGAAWTACEQARARYGSLYSARSNPGAENYRRGFGDPFSGGFRQQPDEWITYTGRVQIGNFGSANNRYTLWAARDGQPYVKIFDGQNIRLGGPGAIPYDVLWLLPYRSYGVSGGRKVGSRTNNIGGTSILACSRGLPLGAGTLEYNASTQRFRWAAAGDAFGPPRGFSIANDILTVNMTSASDKALTTLASGITLPQSTIALTNAAAFPTAGTITISGVQVQYTGKTGNTLTGCTTTATDSLVAGAAVRVESYLVLKIDPAALPASGIVTDTLTIADGRPDTACWYADVIISTQAINAPGGYVPAG